MKIAIVGTGISGLVAAYHLQRQHEVTVFESAERIGGHTYTVDVEEGGRTFGVDTGFIVFNETNYPEFVRLLRELGVAWRPSCMSFGVRCDRTGLEYRGAPLGAIFAQPGNALSPTFWWMLKDIARYSTDAVALLERSGSPTVPVTVTVGEFLAERGYGIGFREQYLVPLISAIWSSPPGEALTYPMKFIARFMRNHLLLQYDGRPEWQVIDGGSRTYVEQLVKSFRERIRTACPVRAVTRRPGGVRVAYEGGYDDFDHAVLACHADQALALRPDPTALESQCLSAFPYRRNVAQLHTDARVMPRATRAWASWNTRIPLAPDRPATVTYNMNMLQGLKTRKTYLVSLNQEEDIDPAQVLRRIVYHHPHFTAGTDAAHAHRAQMADHDGISYCGAYWGNGFHEDGVRSALDVVGALAPARLRA